MKVVMQAETFQTNTRLLWHEKSHIIINNCSNGNAGGTTSGRLERQMRNYTTPAGAFRIVPGLLY